MTIRPEEQEPSEELENEPDSYEDTDAEEPAEEVTGEYQEPTEGQDPDVTETQ